MGFIWALLWQPPSFFFASVFIPMIWKTIVCDDSRVCIFSLQLFSGNQIHTPNCCLTPPFRCRANIMTQIGLCFSPQTWPTLRLPRLTFQTRNPGILLDSSSSLTVNPSANLVFWFQHMSHPSLSSFLSHCPHPHWSHCHFLTVSLQQPPNWFPWIPSWSPLIHYSYCISNKDTNVIISFYRRKSFAIDLKSLLPSASLG